MAELFCYGPLHLGGLEVADYCQDAVVRDVVVAIETSDVIARYCRERLLIAAGWPAIWMRAVEIGIEISADDSLGLVLCRLNAINPAAQGFGDFFLGEAGVHEHVGQQIQSGCEIFLHELGRSG